jgi:GntR family negative regulator for fad regulon and positive regulator of fabA
MKAKRRSKPAHWKAPVRPGAYAEKALIRAILEGHYPAGSVLPGERDLAAQLGVTRPTLRETLARLGRDGWLLIRHGKATRVRDFWHEGGLNVLSALVANDLKLPGDFVPHLLDVRLAMAPAYTRASIKRDHAAIVGFLDEGARLADTPEAFADFDWRLHHMLTRASGNPVYTMILNSFAGFYERMALLYFSAGRARAVSRSYYRSLLVLSRKGDASGAGELTRRMMEKSIMLWREHMACRRAERLK